MDVQLSARFNQGDRTIVVPGFWDGGDTYRIRFSPPTTGQWNYETKSATPDLNGKTGTFTVAAPSAGNHGPVQIFKTYYFRYADGTPYHEFGTTCYAWVHQTEELQEQTLKTLATAPFNKLRMLVFPKDMPYNKNDPSMYPFVSNPGFPQEPTVTPKGTTHKKYSFDFNKPDPAFWRHFEERILDLQKLGIQADIILWHPYDRWGFKNLSPEQDDRYLRYCIARFSAYRNVWWSLANEYDFMTALCPDRPGKKMEDWDRFFSILQKEDPFQRFRGIHHGSRMYDHTKDWVTHVSLQSSNMNAGVSYRQRYQKPVVYDECRYEGNIPEGWGNLNARTMVQRFWLGTLSGCYVGHGETYKDPLDILWWAKGGVLHGESPKRIAWLKDFMAKAPPFDELQPQRDDKGNFVLAKPGQYYLVYCLRGKTQSIELPGNSAYKVDIIDPWEMTETPAAAAQPGTYKTAAADNDVLYRFVVEKTH